VTVDHDSAVPLYLQVAGLLRARIESGELHSRVPSLKTIAQEHGVSHVTAEKAVQVLKDEGLVEVVIGKGIYVRRRLGLAPSSSRHNLPAKLRPPRGALAAMQQG
jgi:GntR family transcriptional regulator